MEYWVVKVNNEKTGVYYLGRGDSKVSFEKQVFQHCSAKSLEDFAQKYGYKKYDSAEKNWGYQHLPCADILRVIM